MSETTKKKRNPNVHALITIVAKQLLTEIRPRYPRATIRAFPTNWGIGVAISFVCADRQAVADFTIQCVAKNNAELYHGSVRRKTHKGGRKLYNVKLLFEGDVPERLAKAAETPGIAAIDLASCLTKSTILSLCRAQRTGYGAILQIDLSEPRSCDELKLWLILNIDDILIEKHKRATAP